MKPDKFKKQRVQMELSQARLAETLGIHPRTIIRYERGHSKIPRRVELALNSLELSLSSSTPAKSRSMGKRTSKRANALRPSQQCQILQVSPDNQMRSKENIYTLGFNISLAISPYLIKHLKGRFAKNRSALAA